MTVGVAKFILRAAAETTAIVTAENPVWRDPNCGLAVALIENRWLMIPRRNERRLARRRPSKKAGGLRS